MGNVSRCRLVLKLTVLLWLCGPAPADAQDTPGNQKSPSQADASAGTSAETFEFHSGYFATPITIPDDPNLLEITSIKLKVVGAPRDGGQAHVFLSEDELAFNEFGDAQPLREGRSEYQFVKLQAVPVEDPHAVQRKLFKLVFPDGEWINRIYFVWSPRITHSSGLLVRDGEGVPPPVPLQAPRRRGDFKLLHLLPLRDSAVPDGEPQETLQNPFSFVTCHFRDEVKTPNRNSQGYITLGGTLDGTCDLTHDRNWMSFTPFGDVASSTLVGFIRTSYQMKELPVKDPLKQGRRVFKLIPIKQQQRLPLKQLNNQAGRPKEEPPEYSLVTSPTTAVTRRLIIRKDDKIRHVLPLYDPNWKRFQQLAVQLERTSDREQQAIAEIRKVIGRRFRFTVEQDQVASIALSEESGCDETVQHLKDLPHLRDLKLSYCPSITPEALEVLESLTELESLSLSRIPIDAVLTHLEHLGQLQSVRISDVLPRNASDDDVPHLTDRGVVSLAKLESLQHLSLRGGAVTDACVKHLVQLKKLRMLHFQDTGLTFGGLVQLAESLPGTRIDGYDSEREYSVSFSKDSVEIQGHLNEQKLQHLSSLKNLKRLLIMNMEPLTDKGLKHLAALEGLEDLQIQHGRAITDDGLKHLKKLTSLKELNLWYCRNITDEGLIHLFRLKKLERLNVSGTKVTPGGIAQLKARLPNCKIER